MDATMGDKTLSTLTSFLLFKNVEKEFSNCNSDLSSTTNTSNSEDDKLEDILLLNIELELIYLIFMVGETRGETVFTEKIENYVERVIPGYSRTVFKEHFR
ncbi:unnamed protein product [Lasius platythorax]|uniref:Uncharacterized protein n=1 Tax=Lasius platythorax TaxID=488582 RepID=A0AAV2P521_9HYME